MSAIRTTYAPRPGTTPEVELDVLANVYKLILDSGKKRGHLPGKSGPENARKESKHVSRKSRIPQQG